MARSCTAPSCEPACAVQALLLVGYSESEFKEIQAFMNSMDAQMVALHSADATALHGKLCDAFAGEQGYREAPEGTQRALIMSGMYTQEVSLPLLFHESKYAANSLFLHLVSLPR